ncbi:MAG: DUF2892 domain-containing protein [Bacteroidia bacterium]|nr:DUF2892 domain-containing protein [Bacteroidia bacterium]
MHTNISIFDSIIRIILGSLIGAVSGAFGLWIGVIAVIPIVTGLASWCPLYAILGISTVNAESPYASDSIESTEEKYRMAS